MPSELALRLTGGVNNTEPERSIGGETSAWPVDLVNLFPNVSIPEAFRGQVLYRSLDLVNLGNQGAHRVRVWCAPGAAVEIGISETTDVYPIDPGGPPWDHGHFVGFAAYTKAAPLAVADILCGGKLRLWLRRTIAGRTRAGMGAETLRLSYL